MALSGGRFKSGPICPAQGSLDRPGSGRNRAACSGRADADSRRSRRWPMPSTDIALGSYRSNRDSLRATSTTDIPKREPSRATGKRPHPMRPPVAKVPPFEFRLEIAATWRFWIEWNSRASFFSPRKSSCQTAARQDATFVSCACTPLAERPEPESGYSRTRKNWNSPSRRGANCRAYSRNGDPGNIAPRYSSCYRRERGNESRGRSSGATSKASQPSPAAETLFKERVVLRDATSAGRRPCRCRDRCVASVFGSLARTRI